ncbi:MAG: hypothetical protein JW913_10840 [Chitinispirillaceae bacterium]|nr:hypothetical protein [Chitinispirillaceae bacterium]
MKRLMIFAVIAAILLRCNHAGDVSSHGGGDDVTTATVYNPDGTYASNCSVALVPSNAVPGVDTIRQFETTTDSLGRYSFISLPPDTYNIYVKKDDLVSYTSSVVVGTTSAEKLLPDNTLGPSGGISGVVRLSASDDSRTVRIKIIGGTVITSPVDSSGRFSIPGLAEGTYRFRFLPTDSAYRILDTSFTIDGGEYLDAGIIELEHAGDTVVDPDTIIDPDTVVVRDTVIVTDSLIGGAWGPDTTYLIMNDVKVRAGTRLEIREGTQVVFLGRMFSIDGNCIARGTVENPVVITGGVTSTGEGNGQIYAGRPALMLEEVPPTDTVLFDNCILQQFSTIGANAGHPDFYFAITNSIIRHIRSRMMFYIKPGMEFNAGKGIYIINNVFHDCQFVNTVSPDTVYYELPLLVASDDYQLWGCEDPSVQLNNNIFYQLWWNSIGAEECFCYFPHNSYTAIERDCPTDPTCIYGDPLFIDIENGDYRLQPNSPCIGAGKDGVDMGIIFTDNR